MARSQATPGILDQFSALDDPRQAWKVIYPLPEILLLVLAATLAAAEDFVEIEEWGNEHLDFLRTFLPYEHDIPSHDALNDLVNALDPELFKACVTSWVETLRDDDPDSLPSTARHRGARTTAPRAASRCISCRRRGGATLRVDGGAPKAGTGPGGNRCEVQ
jgi:hypothetical protein